MTNILFITNLKSDAQTSGILQIELPGRLRRYLKLSAEGYSDPSDEFSDIDLALMANKSNRGGSGESGQR